MFILVLLYNHFHGNYLTQWNYPMFLHPYISVLPKVPTPTPASHWPLHLWLWLTYPWLSGYQPFEIWHQTFCIVRVLDRAFFWPLFGISSLTTHCIYYFFKSIFSDPFWVFFSNWNLPLLNICLLNKWLRIYESHIFELRIKTLDLLQSLLTHLVNMWTFFFSFTCFIIMAPLVPTFICVVTSPLTVTYNLLQCEAMIRLQNFLLVISCLKTIHLRMCYLQMYDCKFPFFSRVKFKICSRHFHKFNFVEKSTWLDSCTKEDPPATVDIRWLNLINQPMDSYCSQISCFTSDPIKPFTIAKCCVSELRLWNT